MVCFMNLVLKISVNVFRKTFGKDFEYHDRKNVTAETFGLRSKMYSCPVLDDNNDV